jgi:hypothetical protein
MAEGKRPRQSDELAEALVVEDANTFTDEGALEFLMDYTVQDEDHKIISKNLIDKFGDLDGVLSADFKTLCGIKGMNLHMTTLLKLVDHISSSRWTNNSGKAATKMPTSTQQNLLGSDAHPHSKSRHIKAKKISVTQKKTTETRSGIFTNAVLKEPIEILPKLPDTEDLNVTRQFLKKNLPSVLKIRGIGTFLTLPTVSSSTAAHIGRCVIRKDLRGSSGASRRLLLSFL